MPSKTAHKRRYVRLDESSWAEIEALWEVGDVTLAELELRFKISRRTLQARFSKRKVAKGSKAAELASAVKKAVFEDTLSDEHQTTSRAKATREAAYNNAVVIEDLIMSQLVAAQNDPTQALRAASAIKALSLAASGLERLHALKWRALGLSSSSVDPESLPKLIFEDLTTADIVEFRHNQEHNEDDVGDGSSIIPSLDESTRDHSEDETEGDDDIITIGFEDTTLVKARLDANGCRMVRGA